jgi:hypothetical protein
MHFIYLSDLSKFSILQAKKDKAASETKVIESAAKTTNSKTVEKPVDKKMQLGRTDIDGEESEDMQESYFKYVI